MLVHKSLFEYLYGVYGCDYFIQAKQSHRNASNLSTNRRNTTTGNTVSGENSSSATRADTSITRSKQNSVANNNLHFQVLKTKDLGSQVSSLTGTSSIIEMGNAQRSPENSRSSKKEEKKQLQIP